MGEKLRSIMKQLSGFWATLSTPKRLALVFVTVGVLVLVLSISLLGSRERYSVLFSDLTTEDAAAIVEKLDKQQVPYKLDGDGTIIRVPEDRVHALRLELASGGLPRGGGVGFELFDRSQIGATEFEQQVNLRRALEGELVRSITTVEGVRGARVHLVLPERRLFVSKRESASASVVLKLDNPHAFGRKEVAGIVHLVSAAVPGLTRDRVSVISTEGVTLHRPDMGESGAGGLTDVAAENSRLLASQLENDVQAQLERVVGPGNADVRVNVALDSAARERTEEHYEPSKTALRSEHKVEESTGREEAGVAGIPGARTNLPDAQEGQAPPEAELGAGDSGVFRRSQTRNWEVDRVTQKESKPPGGVERLSVAVLLNGRWTQKAGKDVFVPRSADEVKELEALVKRAVGFNEARGDSVEVRAMKFAKAEAVPDAVVEAAPWWQRYLPYMAGGALFLLLALMVLLWRSSHKKRVGKTLELKELESLKGGQAALGPGASSKGQLPAASHPKLPGAATQWREHAVQVAAKDPATAAVVLRRWLQADSSAQVSAR